MKKPHFRSIDQDHTEFENELDALESEILEMSDSEVAKQLYERGVEPCDRGYLIELGVIDSDTASESKITKENGFFIRYSANALERIKSYFSSWPVSALVVASTLALGLVVQTATYTTISSKNESNPSPVQVSYDSESSPTNVSTSGNQTQTPTELLEKQWAVVKGTAVYVNPVLSSALLTRVSSGTELEITRTFDLWFEVSTDMGVGFMRSDEVELCNVGTFAVC